MAKPAFVAGGSKSRARSRPRARAASAVVPFPRSASGDRLELARIVPSGRSLLTGFLILLTAVGLYAAARTTSAFAVEQIAVEGAPPDVAAQVRKALAPALGESLLEVDLASLAHRAESIPMVAGASLRPRVPAHAADRGRAGGAGRRAPPGSVVVARRRGRPRRRGARPRRAARPAAHLAEARCRDPCSASGSEGSR